jgi:hypothetical protein
LSIKQEPENLYHYTSIETLAMILENQTLRFNNLTLMDDQQEQYTQHDSTRLAEKTFVNCWINKSEESIPLWAMYGENMQGVRIQLPAYPFKEIDIKINEEDKHYLPADADIVDGRISTYHAFTEKNEEQDYILKYLPSHFKVDGFYIDYTNEPEKLFPEVYKEEQREEKIYDQHKGHGVKTIKEIKWKTDLIGSAKAKDWEFQQEFRYKLFVPWTLEERKNVDRNPEQKVNESTNLTKTLGSQGIIANYFDIDLRSEALRQIHVTAGPRSSQAQKKMIKLLLKDFFQTDNIDDYFSESIFDIY